MYDLLRPLLFKLDAETAHRATLYALGVAQRSGFSRWIARPPADLPTKVFGITFPNPVGLAAGLDKNAEHLDALDALGFGFIEVGTVTPKPQPGNDRPRLFRLPRHEAIINRMGFNNAGVDALVRNVQRSAYHGVLGINIGKNKDTPNEKAVSDYLLCLTRVYELASYVTVNISSPNTQGLRDLQQEATLRRFISVLREAQERLGSQQGRRKPMLLKIAPDLSEAELDSIAEVLLRTGIDGVICTNTTIDHAAVADDLRGNEAGGLSGKPLFDRSTAVLAGMHKRLQGRIPLIGVGGILDGSDAAEKMELGASLVQLYSGLIYRGPPLVAECVDEIRRQREAANVV
ncbi:MULTISPECIES: quinone-dependent dihydroorotate dehydrogenase [Rhodanobacter]|uniref:quinone-dependent dihydroorotate dehydrogenase n=1 Tax=Rhodanobacter TaxID=75309 RepID=UPI0003FB7DF7|nr:MULTISPECIES: quinone-dependent dihydroorotate dehydrogenase [Rhodanobacter]KZC18878.1 dihydroorotate dehydrogenase [Rhodanobacter denitrificans]UJM92422.1 quinone-dependent dihydroorotate dehydrogenase [Rhodanobacter denitrificans]UJM95952.1 quinone-dependent dihydroorotate dehydrogenase [Rhodanobacter denitrificans]UJN21217.1 quinone-dependent dihydroorotate dehydrogenase [Rhodanobacter denitrificans]